MKPEFTQEEQEEIEMVHDRVLTKVDASHPFGKIENPEETVMVWFRE